ncbi:hypothetical protein [Halohasta litorea]|uniref:Ig-like domain-containing protein n=1 Tax=Halohasta litorea TaxID=869891 RepID=A0ABD6D9Y7_9EURY|nr:hypothetical protein [Halohasta litorea]
MRRRLVLGAVGSLGGWSLSGCLDSAAEADGTSSSNTSIDESEDGSENDPENGTDQQTYEQCHFVSVNYTSLPEPIKPEVRAALDDGQYESDELRFDEAVDPDRSYIIDDGTPYEPTVTTDGESRRLELQEADVVRQPEPAKIAVENRAERNHEVRIELTDGDETLVDETLRLDPDEDREIEATDAFGSYELVAETLTGHRETDRFGFSVGDSAFDGSVTVSEDGIFVTQEIADQAPCWS